MLSRHCSNAQLSAIGLVACNVSTRALQRKRSARFYRDLLRLGELASVFCLCELNVAMWRPGSCRRTVGSLIISSDAFLGRTPDVKSTEQPTRTDQGSGSGSGMFYIRLRPSTAIGCGTKQ
jgi:hypothetical protein